MTVAKEIGERLREARMARNLSASEVGKLTRRTKQAIYRYEWGQSEASYDQLARFAKLYGVSLAWLVDPPGARKQGPNRSVRGPVEMLGDDDEERDTAA